MRAVRLLLPLALVSLTPVFSAFFGTTVSLIGGPSDIVLDEIRQVLAGWLPQFCRPLPERLCHFRIE